MWKPAVEVTRPSVVRSSSKSRVVTSESDVEMASRPETLLLRQGGTAWRPAMYAVMPGGARSDAPMVS